MQLGERDTPYPCKGNQCHYHIPQWGGELRAAVKRIVEEMELDKLFAYGYGTHHFWLTHRRLSNGEPKEHRLLIAELWEYEEESL